MFAGFLLSTARTGWEILSDGWVTVRKFKTSLPRYGHTSLEIDTNFIYSIGGKHEEASKWIERYEVDKNSEKCVELNNPRFFPSWCAFNNKYIYIYGGYSSENNSLLNSIERLDHSNWKFNPSFYEIDIAYLNGALLQQYDENTLLILGGKSKQFSQIAYYFNWNELTIKTENIKNKNENSKWRVFFSQSDWLVTNRLEDDSKNIYFIDWLSGEYMLQHLLL